MTELQLKHILLAIYYRIALLGPGFAIPAPLSGTLRVDDVGTLTRILSWYPTDQNGCSA